MTVSPAQKITNFPAMTPSTKPGAIPVQNGGPLAAAVLASGGTLTLNGATPVVVANTRVTANSIIIFTLKTAAGTVSPTAPNVLTITPGAGFTVGGVALDTSVYNYAVLG
jgi:hypothetical protein